MNADELKTYGLALYKRLGEAVYLKRATVRIGAWQPQPHYCHDNVAEWIKHKPQHKGIFGYVFFDLRPFGYVEFAAHTAVEIEDGSLVDITPHGASEDYPFIRHVGAWEEFAEVAASMKIRLDARELPEAPPVGARHFRSKSV